MMCVPLVERTSQAVGSRRVGDVKIVGTLSVYSDVAGVVFGPEDLDLLRTLAIHASMGIVNSNLYRELRSTFLKVLQSDQQPLPLRIICAVDSLDAMSSDRPYRKALSAAMRVEQLNRGAGS